MKKKPIIYCIMPCYNEEEIIEYSIKTVTNKYNSLIKKGIISKKSKIVYVDDGSIDKTWDILSKYKNKNSLICCIKLSKNFGNQSALNAGMDYCKNKCDACITLDCDLQQDINSIEQFIDKYNDGNDIVYGIRKSRKTDSFEVKFFATMYYKILLFLGCNIYYNHADYRLVSNKILNVLDKYGEKVILYRAMFTNIGYKHDIIYFDVVKRKAGKSKFNFNKRFKLAFDGITSYSFKPIDYILTTSIIFLFISFVLLLLRIFVYNNILLLIGIIVLCTGTLNFSIALIGQYISRILIEVKDRPKYLIDEILD